MNIGTMDDKRFLKTLIEEIASLDLRNKDATSGSFKAWHVEVLNTLDRLFRSNSMEYRGFNLIKFDDPGALFSYPTYQSGLTQAEVTLNMYLKRLEADSPEKPSSNSTGIIENKIFMVHGRDKAPALELARFLELEFPIKVIFLDEQAWSGDTLIEKLEHHSGVDYAFITLTPDDEGALKGELLKERGRQNVIFEWGVFTGKLGRKKITVLVKGDVEKPSDLAGIGELRFSKNIKECFWDVENELKAVNILRKRA